MYSIVVKYGMFSYEKANELTLDVASTQLNELAEATKQYNPKMFYTWKNGQEFSHSNGEYMITTQVVARG